MQTHHPHIHEIANSIPRSLRDYRRRLRTAMPLLREQVARLTDDEVLARRLLTEVEVACYDDYRAVDTLFCFEQCFRAKLKFLFHAAMQRR